jgi:hypothetical protein
MSQIGLVVRAGWKPALPALRSSKWLFRRRRQAHGYHNIAIAREIASIFVDLKKISPTPGYPSLAALALLMMPVT